MLRPLSAGTYGVVYLREASFTAIKKIRHSNDDRGGMNVTAIREAQILRMLNHPNVMQLRTLYMGSEHLFFELEFLPISLRTLLNGPLVPDAVRTYSRDMLRGLQHCHELSVIHRDIKPENLLIGMDGRLKLADFGELRAVRLPPSPLPPPPSPTLLLRHTPHRHTLPHSTAGLARCHLYASSNRKRAYTPQMVTLWYRSREVLMGVLYDNDVDMWSAGCIMFEMWTGNVLFRADTEPGMLTAITERVSLTGAFICMPPPIEDTDALGLIVSLLTAPEHRLEPNNALLHPFFAKGSSTQAEASSLNASINTGG